MFGNSLAVAQNDPAPPTSSALTVTTKNLWRGGYPEVLETVRDARKTAAKVASGCELSFDRLPQAIGPG
jgi:hypothetical protein